MSKHGAGKGDTYRKVNYQQWSDNYDAIFKKSNKKVSDKNECKDSSTEDRRATPKRSSRRD